MAATSLLLLALSHNVPIPPGKYVVAPPSHGTIVSQWAERTLPYHSYFDHYPRVFPQPSIWWAMLAKAASVHQSGETNRGGRITKEGRSDLRAVMVEAAWVAVEHHPHWKAQFERLASRLGNEMPIVAIARKLLVAIWHVLRKPGSGLSCANRGGHSQIAELDQSRRSHTRQKARSAPALVSVPPTGCATRFRC